MYPVNLKPGEFLYWEIAPQQTVSSRKLLFSDSITRLMSILREDVDPSHNFVFQLLSKGTKKRQKEKKKKKKKRKKKGMEIT
jgi:hypothetical protein